MEPKRLFMPIESKAVTDQGAGEIAGLAAVYGNVDLQDDVLEVGALSKTASDWSRSKSRMPLLDWHGDSLDRIIGSVTQLKSDSQGVWFRAGFTKDQQGQRARQLAKDGHLSGVSIGWLPVHQSVKVVGGKAVRSISEAKLLEISLTPVPANPLAQLSSVKSLGDGKASDPKKPYGDVTYADPGYQSDGVYRYPLDSEAHCRAAWSYINMPKNAGKYSSEHLAAIKGRISAALKKYGVDVSQSSSVDFETFEGTLTKILTIPELFIRKAALDMWVPLYHPELDAAELADGQPTADAAADTGEKSADGTAETKDAAAAYAVSLINPPGPPDGAPEGEPDDPLAYSQHLLDQTRVDAEAAALEASIKQALGG